jgi:hypothetical protein
MFLKFFVLLSVAVVAASQLGGWSPADIKSPEVYEAAKFAVHTQFPDQHANFYVVEAQKQVHTKECLLYVSEKARYHS